MTKSNLRGRYTTLAKYERVVIDFENRIKYRFNNSDEILEKLTELKTREGIK